MVARAVDLEASDVGRAMRDLALEVAERNGVVVDDADGADACRR